MCVRLDGVDGVEVEEVPDPVPGPGEVLVDVRAAAVNFPDVLFVAGRYQLVLEPPFVPGSEFSGDVAAVGPGVGGVAVGDAVCGMVMTGAFAERVVVPVTGVRPKPVGLDYAEAAAYQVTHATAYHALRTIGDAQEGDWVVVLGAGGGVGTATVAIGARLGMRVVAAASSAERLKVCSELGAEATVDYSHEDLKTVLKDITAPGADVVVDPVGGPYAEPALRSVRWGGRYVVVGFATGEIPRIPLNLVLLKGAVIRGFEMRTLAEHAPGAMAEERVVLDRLVAEGLRPHVSETFPLDRARDALRHVAERRAIGKVVITP